ncbi:MAG TPA: OpgC domain-containing protein [Povalibacter sp.]|uniref:OpgC domain-containing protein n=1 Tax=Povalibacter sp. TaxID=1962978 RepID=UPI002CB13208|nr:OpgC domain-containing protein [Povalibacter sp.]HMN45098.1 OpgC domain-containing protein [Povalibacter sp.]
MRSETARAALPQRDAAIDLVRGAGILMIGIDHLEFLCEKLAGDGFINPFVTWLRIGWSGAAEFFVFFSGYLAGIVYLKTLQTHGAGMMWARAAQRSWHIYVVNLLTLCAVLMLLRLPLLWSPEVNEASRLGALMGPQAGAAIAGFLGLQFAPLYFEILNLYIVLLLLVPFVILLSRLSAGLALALSFAVWLAVQVNAAHEFAPWLGRHGNFNPFGWQFVFVLGALAGMHDVFRRLRERFPRERLFVVSGSILLAAFVVKAVDRSGWSLPLIGAFDVPGYDKPNLGALQVAHFLVSVVFVMQIVPRTAAALASRPVRAVIDVGRRSLECFCMSTILVYVLAALLSRAGTFEPAALLLAGAAIVIGLCVFARLVDWIDARPWRGARRTPKDGKEEKAQAGVDAAIVRRAA